MYRQFVLCTVMLISAACSTAADENPKWLAEHKSHVSSCYVKREYSSDGTYVQLGSDTVINACTWLWNNSREVDWFAIGIRAYEYRKLGRYEDALADIDLAISYFRTDQVKSTFTREHYEELDMNLGLMRKDICDDRFAASQVVCK